MERLQRHYIDTLYIQTPCSQQELIDLHSLCVTPGIHTIMVDSIEKGRLLIESLLLSLDCYTNIACITLSKSVSIHFPMYDCAQDLQNQPCIEAFCAEHYFFDFMWIELTQELRTTIWYKNLEEYLFATSVNSDLPVIIIRYSKTTL